MENTKGNMFIGSFLFCGFMFTGGGIGMIYDAPEVGGAIGMGLGFLAMGAVFLIRKDHQE